MKMSGLIEEHEQGSNNPAITHREEFLLGMSDRTRMFFDDAQLAKITNQTIAIAGLGGIGAIILELFARFGVMCFRLIDKEVYEISNLNRQILATPSTLDSWKVDAGVERIKEINPYSEVEMILREKANRQNVERFVKGADILILETDDPSSIVLFHEFARKYRVPLVLGHCISITGGSVQVFDYRDPRQIDGKRLFKSSILNAIACKLLGSKKALDDVTDKDLERLDEGQTPTATLNFVTNLIGCLVVSETIKLITDIGKVYCYPKEIYLDLLNPKMKIRSARSVSNAVLRFKKRLLTRQC